MWKAVVLLAVLFAMSAPPAHAITCALNYFNVECSGQYGVFKLTWDYTCQCPLPPRVKIEVQQCYGDGTYGPWDTVVDQYIGKSYLYDGPYNAYGVRFSITLEPQGNCNCTGPLCAIATATCQTCP